MRSFLVMGLAIAGLALVAAGAFLIAHDAIMKSKANLEAAKSLSAAADGGSLNIVGSAAFGSVGAVGDQISKLKPGDRLIAWGLVLLLLAGLVSGYLDFSLGEAATAGEERPQRG